MKFPGDLKTAARFIREFVTNHPDYKSDSVVSDLINYDLLKIFDQITNGKPCPDLLGNYETRTKENIPDAEVPKPAKNNSSTNDENVT